jgi:hypothetical protein
MNEISTTGVVATPVTMPLSISTELLVTNVPCKVRHLCAGVPVIFGGQVATVVDAHFVGTHREVKVTLQVNKGGRVVSTDDHYLPGDSEITLVGIFPADIKGV